MVQDEMAFIYRNAPRQLEMMPSENESYTTQLCWRCRSLNTEIRKRLFRCKSCGLEYNRDLNGAVNIGNRLLGYMLNSRGSCEPPLTSPVNNAPKGDMSAISMCEGGTPCDSWG